MANVVDQSVLAYLGGILSIEPQDAGMHSLGMLEDRFTDIEFAKRAGYSGIHAPELSTFYNTSPKQNRFLLGYAGVNEKEINDGTKALAAVFADA